MDRKMCLILGGKIRVEKDPSTNRAASGKQTFETLDFARAGCGAQTAALPSFVAVLQCCVRWVEFSSKEYEDKLNMD